MFAEQEETTEKTKRVRGRVKIKKRSVTLEQVGEQLGQDFVSAIYSSIGNRDVTHLDSGDEMFSVVDQYLDGHGMSENLMRLSNTKIEIHIGLDVSGSMYDRAAFGGSRKPLIVPATAVLRLFNLAFKTVERDLPSGVFTHHTWLWASHSHCLTNMDYGDAFDYWYSPDYYDYKRSSQISKSKRFTDSCTNTFGTTDVNDILKILSNRHTTAHWCGSGTSLSSFLSEAIRWEQENSNPSAHRLFIAVTDGRIGDYAECSKLVSLRSGRCENLLLNISNMDIGRVPDSFTGYAVNIFNLEAYIREFLLDFVQRLA